jgi:hypothetical protein
MSTPGRILRLSSETQASADTLQSPRSDVIILTGTTTINNIPAPFGGRVFDLIIYLIPFGGGGPITLGNAGNILGGPIAINQNRITTLIWHVSSQVWFIGIGN